VIFKISIPSGAIKREQPKNFKIFAHAFQFLLVRLKALFAGRKRL